MNQQINLLKKKANTLPSTPGIYLMKDQHGDVVYVGKAKSLKSRVISYFRKNQQHTKKTRRMIYNIADFDTINVDTELDALLLECKLIQQIHPMYNRQMNDTANYRYLDLSQRDFHLQEKRTPASLGPFRRPKQLTLIFQLLKETYLLDGINHVTKLRLEKQLPIIKTRSDIEKWQEINHFFAGEPTDFFDLNQQRLTYLADQWLFEQAHTLRQELVAANNFYQEIKRINDFWHTPNRILSVPIFLPDTTEIRAVKYYQIHFGQIVHSKVYLANEVFTPIATEHDFRPLTASDLDPVCILLHYQQRLLADKGLKVDATLKKGTKSDQ